MTPLSSSRLIGSRIHAGHLSEILTCPFTLYNHSIQGAPTSYVFVTVMWSQPLNLPKLSSCTVGSPKTSRNMKGSSIAVAATQCNSQLLFSVCVTTLIWELSRYKNSVVILFATKNMYSLILSVWINYFSVF